MTTMAEVARLAGVSVTTVSHVLNKTRPVAPETERLVRDAVARTGYRHNLAARALATQSTTTIGLAMSLVTNPYFGELARNVEERLRRAGFSLVLANTNDDAALEVEVIEHLRARRVSGLITVSLEGSAELTATLEGMRDEKFPVVLLDRRSTLEVDQVYSESEVSTFDLAAHLAAQGHRRIAFVAGSPESSTAMDRLTGHRRAVAELGLDDDPALVLAGDSDERRTTEVVAEHLSSSRRASALLVSNNQMTLGALRALRAAGLRIPRDIALVCYDDFDWADLFEPQLTAVAQDVPTLAASAVDLLLARIADPGRAPQRIVVPTALHHRESCGCGRKRYRGAF